MDSLITAAARALAAGDPLGALKRIALREDPPALALRGIAMAQLGDFVRAKALLRSAARAFGPKEAVARARCVVAEAEIALASRELGWPAKALEAARATLEAHGDLANAAYARYLAARRLLLIGRIDEAERTLAELDSRALASRVEDRTRAGARGYRDAAPPHEGGARSARTGRARSAPRSHPCADGGSRKRTRNSEHARRAADWQWRATRLLMLEEVEALLASKAFVVDACRNVVRHAGTVISLAKRPVLFALARALGEAWPGDVARDTLVARAFGLKRADESHRARLRVEIGRLRKVLRTLADVSATKRGFALKPRRAREIVVLAPPVEEEHAAVLAFLADGESWSSSALALALGNESAHRAARARLACGSRQGAVVRPRPGSPLDDPAGAGIHDDLVTPRSAAD